MFKRLFFGLLGLGAGVVLGAAVVRKAEKARQRMTPAYLAGVAGQRAEGMRGRIDLALAAGREAALAKEAQLRAVYRVSSDEDLVPPAPSTPAPTPSRRASDPGGSSAAQQG